MRMLKALVTGHKEIGIQMDKFLHNLKYECIEDEDTGYISTKIRYSIVIPENKKDRIVTGSNFRYRAVITYSSEVIKSVELISHRLTPPDILIMKVDYQESTFMMKINVNDQEASIFKFEDMRSPDFIFNFDIELGLGEAIKEYIQEIDWFFSEYGFRQYLN